MTAEFGKFSVKQRKKEIVADKGAFSVTHDVEAARHMFTYAAAHNQMFGLLDVFTELLNRQNAPHAAGDKDAVSVEVPLPTSAAVLAKIDETQLNDYKNGTDTHPLYATRLANLGYWQAQYDKKKHTKNGTERQPLLKC